MAKTQGLAFTYVLGHLESRIESKFSVSAQRGEETTRITQNTKSLEFEIGRSSFSRVSGCRRILHSKMSFL